MALRYVLDEQLRGQLWSAIQQHNRNSPNPLDATRVGDPPDLSLGASDPDILAWAQRNGRVVVSIDWQTMPGHYAAHLQCGRHAAGLFMLRARASTRAVLASFAGASSNLAPDQVRDLMLVYP